MKMYELIPTNGRKSFYGKAQIIIDDDGTETLYSYGTPIISRNIHGKLTPLYTGNKYGSTTSAHVKAFCGITKDTYRKLLKANGKELEE